MSRALTEAAQSRLTLISGARDDLFREKYERPRDLDLLIQTFKAQQEAARRADGFERLPDVATDSLECDRDLVVEALRAHGFHPYWVDLSVPGRFGAVGRAVVPGLEPPSDLSGYRPGARARFALGTREAM